MKKTDKVLLEILSLYKWQLAGVLLIILAATGFEVLTPWPFKLLIDNVLGDELLDANRFPGMLLYAFHSKEALGTVVVFLFFAANVLSGTFEYLHSNMTALLMKKIVYTFSERAFNNFQEFDYTYYRNQDVGDYIYRLSYDVSALREFIEDGIFPIITSVVFLLVTTIILLQIDVVLTLLSLIIVPLLALSLFFLNSKIVKTSKRSESSNSALFTYVQQALSQLKIIQAFSQERITLASYNEKMQTSLEYEYRVYRLNFLLTLVMGLTIAVGYALIIGMGIHSIFLGQMSAGLLIVYIFYLDNLTQPVLNTLYAVSDMKQSHVRLNRLTDIFNPKRHTQDKGTVTEITDTTITLKHVGVASLDHQPILHDVTCTFYPNTINAVIGVSGSGKSSLAALLLRLIDHPDKGEVKLGEHSLTEYTLTTLRQNIAFVPQEATLFNETIEDIISFGNPKATGEVVERAAKLATATSFIRHHPGSYQFKVGDQGNLLSGGQRQRLMLARAYAKDAKIMILDEIFASQDPTTRKMMIKNLREYAKDKTVILITNILDVLEGDDTIVVMDQGTVKRHGRFKDLRHDALLKKAIEQEHGRR